MSNNIETQLSGLQTDLKGYIEGQKSLQREFGEVRRQVDAIDLRAQESHGSGGFAANRSDHELRKAIDESPEFARFRELGKGVARISLKNLPLEVKTTLTEAAVGSGTSGVIMPQRVGPIVPQAQRRLFVRDLLSRGNRVSTNTAYYVAESAFTNNASPQAGEGAVKGESAEAFTTVARPVITIAHWIPVSRQLADDAPALVDFVKTKLLWVCATRKKAKSCSEAVSNHLSGLVPSAAAFSTSLLHASEGWNKPRFRPVSSSYIPTIGQTLRPGGQAMGHTFCRSRAKQDRQRCGASRLWSHPASRAERFWLNRVMAPSCSTGWMQRSRFRISIRISSPEI